MVYKCLYTEVGLFLWLLAFHMLFHEDCNVWVFCDVLSSDSTLDILYFYCIMYVWYIFFLTYFICFWSNYLLKMLFEYYLLADRQLQHGTCWKCIITWSNLRKDEGLCFRVYFSYPICFSIVSILCHGWFSGSFRWCLMHW